MGGIVKSEVESAAFGELKAQSVNLARGTLDNQEAVPAQALAFARPHDLELHRHRTGDREIKAIIRSVKAIEPLVRVELTRKEDDELIQVEVTQERYRELWVKQWDGGFVQLKHLRLFLEGGKPEAPPVPLD